MDTDGSLHQGHSQDSRGLTLHPMAVSIKDIAKTAGVSPSTVSRALSDHPRISQETKTRICRLAKEMRYTPSLLARSLVTRDTATIGVVVAQEHLLSCTQPPTAVFCFNDMTAIGVLSGLHQAKVRVPEEMSVVGFDDVESAALLSTSHHRSAAHRSDGPAVDTHAAGTHPRPGRRGGSPPI